MRKIDSKSFQELKEEIRNNPQYSHLIKGVKTGADQNHVYALVVDANNFKSLSDSTQIKRMIVDGKCDDFLNVDKTLKIGIGVIVSPDGNIRFDNQILSHDKYEMDFQEEVPPAVYLSMKSQGMKEFSHSVLSYRSHESLECVPANVLRDFLVNEKGLSSNEDVLIVGEKMASELFDGDYIYLNDGDIKISQAADLNFPENKKPENNNLRAV